MHHMGYKHTKSYYYRTVFFSNQQLQFWINTLSYISLTAPFRGCRPYCRRDMTNELTWLFTFNLLHNQDHQLGFCPSVTPLHSHDHPLASSKSPSTNLTKWLINKPACTRFTKFNPLNLYVS